MANDNLLGRHKHCGGFVRLHKCTGHVERVPHCSRCGAWGIHDHDLIPADADPFPTYLHARLRHRKPTLVPGVELPTPVNRGRVKNKLR